MIFKKLTKIGKTVLISSLVFASHCLGGPTEDIIKGYAAEAKKSDPKFKDFDSTKGREFYFAEQSLKDGKLMSCAECHTKDPKALGKAPTGKPIEPMAPSVNPQRFTDKAKVEKWFKRNCHDVYERLCTPVEKGNFIRFMQSIK